MTETPPLEPHHIGLMTWVKPPGSKSSKQLSHTPELEADFRKWLDDECRHSEFAVVRVKWSDGRPAYRKQCSVCGFPEGAWIGKDKLGDTSSIADADGNQFSQYEEARRLAWQSIALKHYQQQNSEGRLAYDQYLKSPEWRLKSKKVIERAGGICEGCLQRKATQAHHISYRHIFDEFLWELRAVCDACHDRAHAEDDKYLFGDDGSMFELPDDDLSDE